MRFKGSFVALATPFTNNEVNFKDLTSLVNWHKDQGTHGIVPCGTTGESALLTETEYEDVVRACLDAAAGQLPIIPGTGALTVNETVKRTRKVQLLGASAALVVTPGYLKPSQEALYQFFKSVHDQTELPLILYNNPGRAAVTIEMPLVERLQKLPRIQGIKDASPDLTRPAWAAFSAEKNSKEKVFSWLSGEDPTAAAFLAQGGDGCISVTANIAPKWSAELHEAWWNGDLQTFADRRNRLTALNNVLFLATNPTPVKYALSLMGKCSGEVRAPLMAVSEDIQESIAQVLHEAGIIKTKTAQKVQGL